jgi:hypothetical protein
MEVTAEIDGERVSRDRVRDWESRRAAKVLRRLGVQSAPASVTEQREALVARKLELGHEGIERLLARQVRMSSVVSRLSAATGRRRRLCTIELHGPAGTCESVPDFYAGAISNNNEPPLLAACPDHYLLRTRDDGRQEVIETTGGAPLAVQMFFDAEDLRTLTSLPDPAFPTQWAGVARNAKGQALGGIRHQFRDAPDGFRARLTVEFPNTTPSYMIGQHRWHLACEFSNWLEAANSSAG